MCLRLFCSLMLCLFIEIFLLCCPSSGPAALSTQGHTHSCIPLHMYKVKVYMSVNCT